MTQTDPGIFTLWIEETEGHSTQYGFHLGTIESEARKIVQEKFAFRVANNLPIVTMALKRHGKLFDVYYGDKWQSEMTTDGLATIDLNYIHDILVDATNSPAYSSEAKESARALASAIHEVYVLGWRHARTNTHLEHPDEPPRAGD